MPKLRKQRRKKVYRHNVNRKRMRNKMFSVGNIECTEIKKAWDQNKSVRINMEEMGLAYDPNKSIKIPNTKKKLKSEAIANQNDSIDDDTIDDMIVPTKQYVATTLEVDAKAPRAKLFRLPKGQVEWITYLIDKYHDDYKAMARDKRNYNQETWKQIRAKVKRFLSIPEQSSNYSSKIEIENVNSQSDSD